MLQEDQVTAAPSSMRVSMSTAVWTVMWRQPAILAPFSGLEGPYFSRRCLAGGRRVNKQELEQEQDNVDSYIRPGISFSARVSSFLPQSAREMSATL